MPGLAFNKTMIAIAISIFSSSGMSMLTAQNSLPDPIYVQGQQKHQSSTHHSGGGDIDVLTKNNETSSPILSPYTAEQNRTIKSLSDMDILSLQSGTGDAYGGLAKPAELNGYPGPRHVLDLAPALSMTLEQQKNIEVIYTDMKSHAIPIGLEIIKIEKQIENSFANNTITNQSLQMLLDRSSNLYGQLRYDHLSSHLKVIDILTPQQVSIYNEIRGY